MDIYKVRNKKTGEEGYLRVEFSANNEIPEGSKIVSKFEFPEDLELLNDNAPIDTEEEKK